MPFESALDKQIKQLCEARGAFATKTHGHVMQSVMSDWIICYKGYYIEIESKTAEGHWEPGQRGRLIKIQKRGGIAEKILQVSTLKDIFDTLDRGDTWTNTNYQTNKPLKLGRRIST